MQNKSSCKLRPIPTRPSSHLISLKISFSLSYDSVKDQETWLKLPHKKATQKWEHHNLPGTRGSLVSMKKVLTPVGSSMMAFSLIRLVPLYTFSFMLEEPLPRSAITSLFSPSPLISEKASRMAKKPSIYFLSSVILHAQHNYMYRKHVGLKTLKVISESDVNLELQPNAAHFF